MNKDVYFSRRFSSNISLSQLPLSPFLLRACTNFPPFRCLSPTCGWHLYRHVIRIARSSTSGKHFAPFTVSSVKHDRQFFKSSIRWKTKDYPPNWLRKPDRICHEIKRSRSTKRAKVKKISSYLIYGIGRGIIAGVADVRGIFCDRMIADSAVVAHDEAQQIYL